MLYYEKIDVSEGDVITPMNQVNVSFVFVITFLKQIFGFSLEYAIVVMI